MTKLNTKAVENDIGVSRKRPVNLLDTLFCEKIKDPRNIIQIKTAKKIINVLKSIKSICFPRNKLTLRQISNVRLSSTGATASNPLPLSSSANSIALSPCTQNIFCGFSSSTNLNKSSRPV